MLIWTDGEAEIRHPTRCKCGFCKIEKSVECCVKRWAGFFRPRHTTKDMGTSYHKFYKNRV